MIRDKDTGENMNEFLQNLESWKERNKNILVELCVQSKLEDLGKTTSTTSLFSKKPSTQELEKRIQKLSIVSFSK